MTMDLWLEIIVPVAGSDGGLAKTVTSLVSQTKLNYGVVLSQNGAATRAGEVDDAERQLVKAGIPVRRTRTHFELNPIEHWNWAHAQGRAEWLKMLLPGERLKPAYVEKTWQRIQARPRTMVIRCDLAMGTEWGGQILKAPFDGEVISSVEFLHHFPDRVRWVERSINVAYRRAAWRATGGYAVHLPESAALNLNVILALHHGLENIAEPLVECDEEDGKNAGTGWIRRWAETWLVLRQAQNYCLAAGLADSKKWVLPVALAAALRRS
jgi:hypothetical protein